MELEDIYENVENYDIKDITGPQTQNHSQDGGKDGKCRGRRCLVLMTVCLGLICVLLLVFITLYITITAERDLLKSYKNTVEEFNHTIISLQDNYTDLMTEKDQLKNSFSSLSQKKLELETRVNDLSAEKSQLQGSYDSLNQKKLELERKVTSLDGELKKKASTRAGSRCLVLMTVCLGLICVLLLVFITLYTITITAERDLLKSHKNTVEEFNHTIISLQDNYTDLMAEKDQLKNNFNSLSQKKLELETRVNDLSAEKSQLQRSVDALNQKKLELETKVTSLSEELKKETSKQGYQWGQNYLFTSSEPMSWSESRKFCRDRGADLIIINTEEKQRFIKSFIKDTVWIGLSDIEIEGNMKWVDNSPLKQGRTQVFGVDDSVSGSFVFFCWSSSHFCFSISNEKKSWSESRKFCRDRGADLIIINTEEKQVSSVENRTGSRQFCCE
ncbi:unnamed protein product [Leuciscus chuanchicus]